MLDWLEKAISRRVVREVEKNEKIREMRRQGEALCKQTSEISSGLDGIAGSMRAATEITNILNSRTEALCRLLVETIEENYPDIDAWADSLQARPEDEIIRLLEMTQIMREESVSPFRARMILLKRKAPHEEE